MGTGERGCQECDGERRGRGRVLAAGRRREKKLHAAILRGKKQARARGMRGVLRFLPHTTIDQRVGVCVCGGGASIARSATENDAAAGDF